MLKYLILGTALLPLGLICFLAYKGLKSMLTPKQIITHFASFNTMLYSESEKYIEVKLADLLERLNLSEGDVVRTQVTNNFTEVRTLESNSLIAVFRSASMVKDFKDNIQTIDFHYREVTKGINYAKLK